MAAGEGPNPAAGVSLLHKMWVLPALAGMFVLDIEHSPGPLVVSP